MPKRRVNDRVEIRLKTEFIGGKAKEYKTETEHAMELEKNIKLKFKKTTLSGKIGEKESDRCL
jgi:hypothetical protein